jgi:hypothetical protein
MPMATFFEHEQNISYLEDFHKHFEPPRDVDKLIEVARSYVGHVQKMVQVLELAFSNKKIVVTRKQ